MDAFLKNIFLNILQISIKKGKTYIKIGIRQNIKFDIMPQFILKLTSNPFIHSYPYHKFSVLT